MSQIGEGVSAILPDGKEKCVFCDKEHQQDKAANSHTFQRNMDKLKKEGRSYTITSGRVSRYPSEDLPPLVEWEKNITKTGGYKAAAHHCIALKSVSKHEMSGELKEGGYDPNGGNNCSWLPYSKVQFTRARAYNKPLQKHRGGHTEVYFDKVTEHLDKVALNVEDNFCSDNKKADKEILLRLMAVQENALWNGLANPRMQAYHLYNTSYLAPEKEWGTFDTEKKANGDLIDKDEIIGAPSSIIDDDLAEKESENDPE
jgi:hypothetical protein